MRKMTRMVLISSVLATMGLTAKVATENYRAVATNDERIHKAYELAKKPNKAAVLEAIVDATNTEPDERIQKAAVLDPEEPKVVRIKTKVTTSAGVSPISPTMDKKTVNKAEEFIEKIAQPGESVITDILDFSPDDVPDVTAPVQTLSYEIKDIFLEFEEVTEKPLTYRIENIPVSDRGTYSIFQSDDGEKSYGVAMGNGGIEMFTNFILQSYGSYSGTYHCYRTVDQAYIGLSVSGSTIDYSGLALTNKDRDEIIKTDYEYDVEDLSYKSLYEIFSGIEKGTYAFKEKIVLMT